MYVCVFVQTFIQRDPLQTSNVLQLLLSEYGKSDILAPLFHPNLCPNQFVQMYGTALQLVDKEGPTVALSVLTKVRGRGHGGPVSVDVKARGRGRGLQRLLSMCISMFVCLVQHPSLAGVV